LRQNQKNIFVSYSKIGYEFSISKVTTSSYINSLVEKDLDFIFRQNQEKMFVTYSKIGYEFSISKVTTSSYINSLVEKDLVFIKKKGRLKTIHITEKGKALLQRRISI